MKSCVLCKNEEDKKIVEKKKTFMFSFSLKCYCLFSTLSLEDRKV